MANLRPRSSQMGTNDSTHPMAGASTTGDPQEASRMQQTSHSLRMMHNIIRKKSQPQDNSQSSHLLMMSRNDDTCPTGHVSASGDPHNHPCTTPHLMTPSLHVNTLSSPVTGVITTTTDGSQSADAPTASAKPPAAVKPARAPLHAPGVACCPATTPAWP